VGHLLSPPGLSARLRADERAAPLVLRAAHYLQPASPRDARRAPERDGTPLVGRVRPV